MDLDSLAAAQHGTMTRQQALRLGFTTRQVDGRLAAGAWLRVYQGVYRIAGAPVSHHQALMAACLATGGAASHRAGAWSWHLCDRFEVEVVVPASQHRRVPGVAVHRSVDLRPDHVVVRDGIPTTNVLRVLADLGAVLPLPFVEGALERAIGRRLCTFDDAVGVLFELSKQGRNGIGVLRAALDGWGHGAVQPDSVLEAAFARMCKQHDLPMPAFQHEVVVGGRRRRLDAAWVPQMVAVEVDGFASRVSLDRFQDDRTRQNALVRAGWTVLRFTWADVTRRPEATAGALAGVLGAGSSLTG